MQLNQFVSSAESLGREETPGVAEYASKSGSVARAAAIDFSGTSIFSLAAPVGYTNPRLMLPGKIEQEYSKSTAQLFGYNKCNTRCSAIAQVAIARTARSSSLGTRRFSTRLIPWIRCKSQTAMRSTVERLFTSIPGAVL
jgi:hypothetical protein